MYKRNFIPQVLPVQMVYDSHVKLADWLVNNADRRPISVNLEGKKAALFHCFIAC